MDSIQFFHDRSRNESTYAVDVNITRLDLNNLLLSENDTMDFYVGKAKKHPDDQYCKETGREVSKSKMELLKFKLVIVHKKKEKLNFVFRHELTNLHIHLRTSTKSDKPHLILVG